MSAEPQDFSAMAGGTSANDALLATGLDGLAGFAARLRPLRDTLRNIEKLGDATHARRAVKLRQQLDGIEPSVTMIGQIKSGKTTLVNAMVGWPDLLPADVNPWTSVVTSLHLCPGPIAQDTRAVFRFFDRSEWDRLISGGGRMGELAGRAGAEDELETIKRQVAEMRAKSMARLGHKFEMLLGQEHRYGQFDPELVERYVCLGDDFDDEDSTAEDGTSAQGRFADISKSADLFLHRQAFPMRLCLRDTPGVNDTFMMREQITIQAIRESRICVVVLSAHQALSSTDLALVRLISNVKSRDVIIFVNRVDELADPGRQIPEIRRSIQETLERHKGPKEAEILFGSALWASFAMSGKLARLPQASAEALYNWAASGEAEMDKTRDPLRILWDLSGLPALYRAVSDRIVEGAAREAVDRIATSAANLIDGIAAGERPVTEAGPAELKLQMPAGEVLDACDRIAQTATANLRADLEEALAGFSARAGRALDNFLERATAALIQHLEDYGEQSVWQYDPAGLRVLLNSSYRSFGKNCQNAFGTAAMEAAEQLTGLSRKALNLPEDAFAIRPPPAPRVLPPVALGRTIALDLKGSWWQGWWFRRRGYRSFASKFHDLIRAETEIFVTDLTGDYAFGVCQDAIDQFAAFLAEQRGILQSAVRQCGSAPDQVDELLGLGKVRARASVLAKSRQMLKEFVPC